MPGEKANNGKEEQIIDKQQVLLYNYPLTLLLIDYIMPQTIVSIHPHTTPRTLLESANLDVTYASIQIIFETSNEKYLLTGPPLEIEREEPRCDSDVSLFLFAAQQLADESLGLLQMLYDPLNQVYYLKLFNDERVEIKFQENLTYLETEESDDDSRDDASEILTAGVTFTATCLHLKSDMLHTLATQIDHTRKFWFTLDLCLRHYMMELGGHRNEFRCRWKNKQHALNQVIEELTIDYPPSCETLALTPETVFSLSAREDVWEYLRNLSSFESLRLICQTTGILGSRGDFHIFNLMHLFSVFTNPAADSKIGRAHV